MTLIENETSNNPFTAPSPITLSKIPDPETVIKNTNIYAYFTELSLMNTANKQSMFINT